MRPLKHRRPYLFAILAIAFVCGTLLLSTFSGRDIPSTTPDPSHTITHPLGFSIVAPPNWEHTIRTDSAGLITPGIYLTPKATWPPRRYHATMSVAISDSRERERDAASLSPSTFQGQPALSSITTGQVGDGVSQFNLTTHFPRNKKWFVIRYNVYADISELPRTVSEYLNTFRYDTTGA